MAIESIDDRLLTVPEVAERLRVHPITVRRHIKAGRLKAVRVGRNIRVRPEDLEEYLRPEIAPGILLPYRWPPTPEEIKQRRKLMEEMFARRDAQPPLGITTAELVRQARRDLERRHG
jgi:excisionase family DNA binding protein